jgi:nucleoside-diphosphate-sugar epimerase
LLIVGCGDVGMRVVALLRSRWRIVALTSSEARIPALRAAGVTPLLGNLDDPSTLTHAAACATHVLHLAPPPTQGVVDTRTRHLVHALARGGVAHHLVYGSTSGVYGDAQGAWVKETRATAPVTPRALRRVDAEQAVRRFGRVHGATVCVLRIPGIYALDRDGGSPVDRVRVGTPVLQRDDDVYTNHVHADDLARACVAALMRGKTQRTYHASDDDSMLMGDHMDRVADITGLPRPPRISRAQAVQQLSPMTMTFLSESRRLDNTRLKQELRLRLHYPTVSDALR